MTSTKRKSKEEEKPQEAAEEEEYFVERIIDKRLVGGKTEYFLKWKGYPESENSWEPVANLDCPELIKEFEINYKKKMTSDEKPVEKKRKMNGTESGSEATPPAKKKVEEDRPRGFDRKLEPDRIVGATDSSGELMFLIKWKGCDEADLVPSKLANAKCPQTVIKFYEERLTWHSANNCEEEDNSDAKVKN